MIMIIITTTTNTIIIIIPNTWFSEDVFGTCQEQEVNRLNKTNCSNFTRSR